MGELTEYSLQHFTSEMSTDVFTARYLDKKRIEDLCRKCPDYGLRWTCPPLDLKTDKFWLSYSRISILVTKVCLSRRDIPFTDADRILRIVRLHIEDRLLDMEHHTGGRSFASGKCLRCTDGECNRKYGNPCRFPDKARLSLEASDFDMEQMLTDVFDIQLQWAKDGLMPPYFILVGALLHNETRTIDIHLD